jgi:hypothetical protein
MDKKSTYRTVDGRIYDVTMTWDEKFKDADKIFKIEFGAIDQETKRAMKLPREIATFAIGDSEETLGERVKYYFNGSRETLMTDYLTTAYRRATDYIERGK